MKFFLDTANIQEIREAVSWGIISGVTTNPTLVAREEGSFEDMIKVICQEVDGPVSVEAVSTRAEDMVAEARRLARLASNVVVKIPMGVEGLKAVSRLEGSESIHCNVTLVFSVNQALLAARAGASYISPFVGRIDDIGWDGMELIREMVIVLERQKLVSQVIAASIRHPRHVHESAAAGAPIATLPFSVLQQMAEHPLTDRGIQRFLADWEKVQKNMG